MTPVLLAVASSAHDPLSQRDGDCAELVRVRGLVQGVGFRPTVWRLARQFRLRGWVGNDGAGVSALLCGAPDDIAGLVDALQRAPPPLARIDGIERTPVCAAPDCPDFRIIASRSGEIHTGVVPDAATCPACRDEIFDPEARRYRYPFANCTHCGPRLSIIEAIPYDRATTTMRSVRMCAACAAEYRDPADRRFHAQPIACAACGPRVWLAPEAAGDDAVDVAHALLLAGRIVAVKALGGFHLACDATDAMAVARLRQAKQRDAKPFALMARDVEVIRRYAVVTDADSAALQSPAAPIVVLQAKASTDTPPPFERGGISFDASTLPGVAPGLASLGFMLPSTPLHQLLLRDIDRPLVMTSGNLADEPQCIGNDEALTRLRGIADNFLLHDRDIARRVDDSVVRVMGGAVRVLRRARGYAPAPLPLPHGFTAAPPVLAMGGELKSTFGLLRDGEVVLSHHMGDLENAPSFTDYRRSIQQYCELFAHAPQAVAVDRHPDYLSTKLGRELAGHDALPVLSVQHHHAHLAACMAENGVPLDAEPVLGVVLDGLGWGDDDTIWGGEFLLGDYRRFHRLASFNPVAMPGGARATREPWRNTYAHIAATLGWSGFVVKYGQTELGFYLAGKPVAVLGGMIARHVNAPLASSCGRLFDAVAAAVGFCRDRALYEGQPAMLLEAVADNAALADDRAAYPFTIAEAPSAGLLHLDPTPMWVALLDDIVADTPVPVIAARFHAGLAIAIARMVAALRVTGRVALSGGVFQNRLLLEQVMRHLTAQGLEVLTHRSVPANDGGLALGQAAVAAARMLAGDAKGD
jgi:hydrogenase maturation protein HypF